VTPLDLLWNGWRSSYIESLPGVPAGGGSVFSRILASGLTDEAAHIVHRGARTFVIMNAFPYTTGHVLVLPYREISEPGHLDGEETAELWATVTVAVDVVRSALGADGVNVGLNLGRAAGGSVQEHLHVHVVPRWVGDANFLTTTAYARTLPEALPVTAGKLRAAWPSA